MHMYTTTVNTTIVRKNSFALQNHGLKGRPCLLNSIINIYLLNYRLDI